MVGQRTSGPGTNVLAGRELETRVARSSAAPAEAIWDVLADLRTHGAWASAGGKGGGLTTIEAPAGPAMVGTEFGSTGEDRKCRMVDRSVVTEADRPTVLEFVTESAMGLKRGGRRSDWTVVHRYEIAPTDDGCTVTHSTRVTRASALPGALGVYKVPILRTIAKKEMASEAKRGLDGLVRTAEQRVGALGKEG